jgi:hypothetical protein
MNITTLESTKLCTDYYQSVDAMENNSLSKIYMMDVPLSWLIFINSSNSVEYQSFANNVK